jgi:hypothetical protein
MLCYLKAFVLFTKKDVTNLKENHFKNCENSMRAPGESSLRAPGENSMRAPGKRFR